MGIVRSQLPLYTKSGPALLVKSPTVADPVGITYLPVYCDRFTERLPVHARLSFRLITE